MRDGSHLSLEKKKKKTELRQMENKRKKEANK